MTKIRLEQGDITKILADAIVNAANKTLLGGGGVDGAIHRAAGPKLLAECADLGGCERGQAKITKGYNLRAKFVIHAVGPVWHGGNRGEEKALENCYFNSLELARKHNLRSIAFPAISTGAYRFPIEPAAQIAMRTVKEYLQKKPLSFEEIIFVLFSSADYDIYRKWRQTYFPPSKSNENPE